MGGEVVPLALISAERDQFRVAPGVAALNDAGEADFMGLLHLQRDLSVVVGQEEGVGASFHNLGQLGGEVLVAGSVGLKGDNLDAVLLQGLLVDFGDALVVLRGHIVKHRWLGRFQLFHRELGPYHALEGINEAGAEDVLLGQPSRLVNGGLDVSGPRADHWHLAAFRNHRGRDGVSARVRADHRQHSGSRQFLRCRRR